MILSLLSFSFFSSISEQKALTSYLAKEVSSTERDFFFDLSAKARYLYFHKSKIEPPPPETVGEQELSKNRERKPRLTSKIHITPATFIALKDKSGGDMFSSPGEQLLYNLLLKLYEGIGSLLNTSDQEAIGLVVNALTEALVRYEGKYPKAQAKILANFELREKALQECLWNMLHGRKKGDHEWASLLTFISFKKEPFLTSLWLAPKLVLETIFEDDKTVEELIQKRKTIYETITKKNNKNNEQTPQLESEWNSLCEKNLPSWLPQNMVDLHISKTRPPETGRDQ